MNKNQRRASPGEEIRMFDDLFDFGKKRSLKQSVGFYIFYAGLFLAFGGLLDLLGLN